MPRPEQLSMDDRVTLSHSIHHRATTVRPSSSLDDVAGNSQSLVQIQRRSSAYRINDASNNICDLRLKKFHVTVFCRAMLCKRGPCRHAVSVRLPVRLLDGKVAYS